MGRLINYEDITIRDVSENLEAEAFNPSIDEAEEIDIKQILGNPLFLDLIKNKTSSSPNYVLLLAGGEYTDGAYTYEFKGLKYALQYYAWARYVENPLIHTPSGLVNHQDDFSEKPDQKALDSMAGNIRSSAWHFMSEVITYLNCKSADFPLWRCKSSGNRSNQVKISVLK